LVRVLAAPEGRLMENQIAIAALRRKRADLAGELIAAEAAVTKIRADLASIDRTILLFDPDANPSEIKPRRKVERNAWFRQGECARMIYEILRTASAPMTKRQIAERIMADKGIANDGRAAERMNKTVLAALHRAKGIERLMIGHVPAWRVA
jgi:hypothetical protein